MNFAVVVCIPVSRAFGRQFYVAPTIFQSGQTRQIFCHDKGRKLSVFLAVSVVKKVPCMLSCLRLIFAEWSNKS